MKTRPAVLLFGAMLLLACGSARAQSPVPGQPYQVPPGYEAYGPGTLVAYGGYNYVLQGDGTMLTNWQPVQYYYQQPSPYYYYRQPGRYYYHNNGGGWSHHSGHHRGR